MAQRASRTPSAAGTDHDPRTCTGPCCRRSIRTVAARPALDRDWPVLDEQLPLFPDLETEST